MGVAWKYKHLSVQYREELKKFKAALSRFRNGKAPGFDFSLDLQGFQAFIDEVGAIPQGMIRPSLGRKDHSKGYEPGNIFWQELSENCAENGRRSGPLVGSMSKGRQLSAAHKARISETMRSKFRGAF